MSIKHILIPIEGQDADNYVLETAYKMGQKFNAHLEVLEVMLDGRDAIPFIGQGLSAPVVEQILHSLEAESKDQRNKALQNFNTWRKQHPELLFLEHKEIPQNGKTTLSWTEIIGRNAEIVPEKARVSDMVVLARTSANDDDLSAAMAESTLMEGGCPVLFAVENMPKDIGSNITLFWNGSLECARAVHFALPFLKKASKVTVLTTSKVDTMGESGAALKNYLAYHNINVDLIDLECDTSDIGASILKNSYDLKADLFILGAYCHSKLREWVLGSITRYVLKEATIPCLLIH
ncbi:MAG: universal stress protein [Alphaproteobacteria bacterium]|nr:universal stress protein [Alphaproteobacteria bacterium]